MNVNEYHISPVQCLSGAIDLYNFYCAILLSPSFKQLCCKPAFQFYLQGIIQESVDFKAYFYNILLVLNIIFKVTATSFKLEIRLHGYQIGMNTQSGTE